MDFHFYPFFRCLRLTLPTAGRTRNPHWSSNQRGFLGLTERRTASPHQRSPAGSPMHAMWARNAATWGRLSDRYLRDARQHRAMVDGVKSGHSAFAATHVRWAQPGIVARAATASGAWAGGLRRYRAASLSSTVPKCFTARRFAQPGSESSLSGPAPPAGG